MDIAVDNANQKVFVTNRKGNSVSVIDVKSNKVVDTISVGNEPIGIAIHPTANRAYTANYSDSTISVIDTVNHKVIDTIKLSGTPDSSYFGLSWNVVVF